MGLPIRATAGANQNDWPRPLPDMPTSDRPRANSQQSVEHVYEPSGHHGKGNYQHRAPPAGG
jgi:hypothetical protein